MRKVKVLLTLALIFFVWMIISGSAYAAEESLTLDQAIDLALKNSTQLKQDQFDIEKNTKIQKELYNSIENFSPLPYYSPEEASLTSNYKWAYYNTRLAEKKYEYDKNVVTAQAMQKYFDVLNAQNSLKLAELNERNESLTLSQILSKQKVGMATDLEVTQAKVALEKSKVSTTAAKATLENAYNSLNDYLDLEPGSRPNLVSNILYSKLENKGLDFYINKALTERLDYWAKEEAAEVSEQVVDFAEIWKVGDIESQKAFLDAAETRETVIRDVTKAYNDILNLEQTIATLEESLTMAKKALKTAEVQYAVGIITYTDKLSAETKVLQAQNALDTAIYQHRLAVTSFPLLAGLNSGAGSSNTQSDQNTQQ